MSLQDCIVHQELVVQHLGHTGDRRLGRGVDWRGGHGIETAIAGRGINHMPRLPMCQHIGQESEYVNDNVDNEDFFKLLNDKGEVIEIDNEIRDYIMQSTHYPDILPIIKEGEDHDKT